MFSTLIAMALACWMYSIAVVLVRAQADTLRQERFSSWARELVGDVSTAAGASRQDDGGAGSAHGIGS
jgi:hypothetical protein